MSPLSHRFLANLACRTLWRMPPKRRRRAWPAHRERCASQALEFRVVPTISASDTQVVEPLSGIRQMVFTLTRKGSLDEGLSVGYSTQAVSATPGLDYVEQSGTAVFGFGIDTTTISIGILKDNLVEGSESFELKLEEPDVEPVFVTGTINDRANISGFSDVVNYVTGFPPRRLDLDVAISDLDTADYAGGQLTVRISINRELTDRLLPLNVGSGDDEVLVTGDQVQVGGLLIASFTGGLESTPLVFSLNENATPNRVQSLLRALAFHNVSATPLLTIRTIEVSLTDGDGGASNVAKKNVTVVAKNSGPVLGAWDGTVTYHEPTLVLATPPLVLDSNSTVSDLDAVDLDKGRLTVKVSANSQSSDRVGIRHVGNGAGQIGVEGATVKFGGTVIGTFAGTTTLTVTFNASATAAAVQALLRNVTFSTISDKPSALPRTLSVLLTDGDGGTSNQASKTVNVIPKNDAPVLAAWDGAVTYYEPTLTTPQEPVVIDGNATAVDGDSGDLDKGSLIIRLIANSQSTDRLGIRHVGNLTGQIGVDGSTVKFGGTTIGTFLGTTTLVVSFNASATPDAALALLRNITFSTLSDNPSALPRTVTAQMIDGDGGTSALVSKTINVIPRNDGPSLGFTAGSAIYRGTPVLLDNRATAADADSANLESGLLTVRVAVNAELTDRLEILHQGTAAGEIGISGDQVTFGGILIGTFTGTTILNIELTSDATATAIQALLRRITFRSTASAPSQLARTITALLSDGDGGISNLASKSINVL